MRRPTTSQFGMVLGGALVGATLARVPAVVDLVTRSDWSSVPSTAVGSAIPAAGGFFFARALATNSVRTIKAAELAAEEEHVAARRRTEVEMGRARAAAWNEVYDLSQGMAPAWGASVDRGREYEDRLTKLIFDEWRAALDLAKTTGGPHPDSSDTDRARTFAATFVDWPGSWGGPAQQLSAALHSLVTDHDVAQLFVVERTVSKLAELLVTRKYFLPADFDTLVDVFRDRSRSDRNAALVGLRSAAWTAVAQLRALAAVYRAQPSAAEDVDTRIEWQEFRSAPEIVDVTATFAHLEDLLDALPEPDPFL